MKNCVFMSLGFWAQRFHIDESKLKWGIAVSNVEGEAEITFPVVMVQGSSVMIDIQRDSLLTCKTAFGRTFTCLEASMAELQDRYVFTSGSKMVAVTKKKLYSLYENKVFDLLETEEKVLS